MSRLKYTLRYQRDSWNVCISLAPHCYVMSFVHHFHSSESPPGSLNFHSRLRNVAYYV